MRTLVLAARVRQHMIQFSRKSWLSLNLSFTGVCQMSAALANDRCNLRVPTFDSLNGALFE